MGIRDINPGKELRTYHLVPVIPSITKQLFKRIKKKGGIIHQTQSLRNQKKLVLMNP
jgi:hypothetical protein